MARYNSEMARNASLAQGIGSVFGTVAGTVGSRPSAMDEYFNRLYGSSSGFSNAG